MFSCIYIQSLGLRKSTHWTVTRKITSTHEMDDDCDDCIRVTPFNVKEEMEDVVHTVESLDNAVE